MSGHSKWGYVFYDVDSDDERYGYTRYEKDGSVNKYHDNGDGGHSHEKWKDENDYNDGKNSDFYRDESNYHTNPSEEELQDRGDCFLTTACMRYFQNDFDDECYELLVLRRFRDMFVVKEDINHYYRVAPLIVSSINAQENQNEIYNYIYENVIKYCINNIEKGNYELAYDRYKSIVISLERELLENDSLKLTL